MADLGIRKLVITGGEPLLHPQIEAIVQLAYASRLHTSLVTNGLLLTERRLQSLMDAGLLGITVSLDSLDADTYRRHRGLNFPRSRDVIKMLATAARLHGLAVSLNSVMTAFNYRELPDLVRFASRFDLPLMIQPCNTDCCSEPAGLLPTADELAAVSAAIDEIIALKQGGARVLSTDDFLRLSVKYWAQGSVPPVRRCYYGHVTATVRYTGDVVPCWRLAPVGNVHEQSIVSLWRSDAFVMMRHQMLQGRCSGCWLACSFDWQVLWQTDEAVRQFWETRTGVPK